jgi:hypothetical protein
MSQKIKIEFKIPSFNKIIPFIKKVLATIWTFGKRMFKQYCTIILVSLLNILKSVLADLKNKRWRGLIILAISIAAYFLWGFSSFILWLIFLAFLAYGWENGIMAACAIICLVSCPIMLAYKAEALTEQITVYAFFFIVMAVILQMINYKFGEYLRGKNLW